MDSTELKARARRAYEVGRLGGAAKVALWTAPLVAASMLICRHTVLCLSVGALLTLVCATFAWRGRALGRAVLPGLLSGAPAVFVPAVLALFGRSCADPASRDFYSAACLAAGLLAGIGIFFFARRLESQRRQFCAAAMLVAAITGTLGCALFGIGGLIGLCAGVAAASAPALLVRQRSA